jgi:bromodomain-containing factor 1
MDEDLEAEKIRRLEDRMKLFDKNANGDAPEPHAAHVHDSEHSSESSSDDDSSGSESE